MNARSTSAATLAAIWPLLGRPIAFHRRLVDLTGSVKAALLLSQAIYWTRRGRDVAKSSGWFHKTAEQWTWETGLSSKEQSSARDALKVLALVEERRTGIPARLHFRLNARQLGRQLAEQAAVDQISGDWDDVTMVIAQLGPAVAYYRSLAGISGGVHAALMLSRSLYLTRMQTRRDLDAWVCNSAQWWSEDIGLTRREQETARRELAHAGVWEERVCGMPPSRMARIRLDRVLALLTLDGSAPAGPHDRGASPVGGLATNRGFPNGESEVCQFQIQVSPKAPSLFSPNRHHSSAESAKLNRYRTTRVLLQIPIPLQGWDIGAPTVAQDLGAGGGGGGGDLIFPEQMLPDECEAARRLLRPCADQAQTLLDELSGRLQDGGVRGCPVAYLRGLIQRAAAGSFVPELAPRMATERQQRQEAAEQRRARDAEERHLEAQRAAPAYQASVRVQRERLRQLRDDMKQRIASARRS
jgi:hypothetical protein